MATPTRLEHPSRIESARVNPTVSATWPSSAVPACETRPAPSAVTSTVAHRPSRITRKVTSKLGIRTFDKPKNPCCARRCRAPGHPGGAGLPAGSGLVTPMQVALSVFATIDFAQG
jgi:hypothetical protein